MKCPKCSGRMFPDRDLSGRVYAKACWNCGFRSYVDFKIRPGIATEGDPENPKWNNGKAYSAMDIAEIKRGLATGLTCREIGKKLGRSHLSLASTIGKLRKKGELP